MAWRVFTSKTFEKFKKMIHDLIYLIYLYIAFEFWLIFL